MANLTPDETLALIQLSRHIGWFYELQHYTDAQLKQLFKIVRQAEADILARIDTYAATIPNWYEDRALAVLDALKNMGLGIRYTLENGITNIAATAGAAAFLMNNDIASFGGMIAPFNNVSLTAEQLRGLLGEVPVGGRLLQEWVADNYTGMIEGIREEITAGMIEGSSYPMFVNRLTSAFEINRQDATMLARTYVQSVNTYAQMEVYQANSDIIKGIRWTSTLETGFKGTGHGTCIRCAALDGNVYALDEKKPPCPLHPHCRCLYIPQLVSWKSLGIDMDELEEAYRPYTTRPDKAIGEGGRRTIEEVGFHDGNYASWYATRDDTFKKNLLGINRFRLIEQGKVDFGDLIDRANGRLRTLAELKNE